MPVSNGSHRKFARVSGPCAQEQQGIENSQKKRRGTVAAKLDDIVARVGMRRLEEGNYSAVNYFERIGVEDGL
jgi:hypothetical protein